MHDRSVTGRVVQILEIVRGRGPDVPLAEIAARTRIPKPSVLRIANDLVARGLLERRSSGYRLGLELLTLGSSASDQQGYHHAATPYLHDLHNRTGQLVWLGIVSGDRVTMVDRVFGRSTSVDMTMPWPPMELRSGLAATAVGRMVLANRPELTEALLRSPLPRPTPYTAHTRRSIEHAIARVRDEGYAVEHEQFRMGLCCAAAPIFAYDGSIVGAIAVTGPTGAFAPERVVRPLTVAAQHVTARSQGTSTPRHSDGWNAGMDRAWPRHEPRRQGSSPSNSTRGVRTDSAPHQVEGAW